MRVKGNGKEMKSRRLDKGWENEDNNEKNKKTKMRDAINMTSYQLDCTENRYLLWQNQKSSPSSAVNTTSPLSLVATRHVIRPAKETVIARAKKKETEEGGIWGERRNKPGWLSSTDYTARL